jgi:hypothetical protein
MIAILRLLKNTSHQEPYFVNERDIGVISFPYEAVRMVYFHLNRLKHLMNTHQTVNNAQELTPITLDKQLVADVRPVVLRDIPTILNDLIWVDHNEKEILKRSEEKNLLPELLCLGSAQKRKRSPILSINNMINRNSPFNVTPLFNEYFISCAIIKAITHNKNTMEDFYLSIANDKDSIYNFYDWVFSSESTLQLIFRLFINHMNPRTNSMASVILATHLGIIYHKNIDLFKKIALYICNMRILTLDLADASLDNTFKLLCAISIVYNNENLGNNANNIWPIIQKGFMTITESTKPFYEMFIFMYLEKMGNEKDLWLTRMDKSGFFLMVYKSIKKDQNPTLAQMIDLYTDHYVKYTI